MSAPETWIADDLATRRRARRLVVWFGLVAGLVGGAALLFVATSPPRPSPAPRAPGVHGRVASVDLLPGYEVDTGRGRLGPARLWLDGERPVFVPADTPYTGAAPCEALRHPEDETGGRCALFVWLGEDGRTATWLTPLRPGGPGEGLLDGVLIAGSGDRLRLDDGTTLRTAPRLRLSECADRDLADIVGDQVVISVDDESGLARQVTCRVG